MKDVSLCTLTVLPKIQQYFRRTPANGPPNKAKKVHLLLDGHSGNRFKQLLQCSGLIKAPKELSTFNMTDVESLHTASHW